MKRIHLALLVGALALGAHTAMAQQPTQKKGSAQHDSLKTVKKSLRADKAARKAAKAKGDTATAHKLKKQIKAEKKEKAALKAETGKPVTPKKQP